MTPEARLAAEYAPAIMLDLNEPFFPRWVGYSVLEASGPSPSFRRDLKVPTGGSTIEYAVYWDWDIGHYYDLEHAWVYIGADGEVADCEGSFHGRYLKGLLPDRSNLSGRQATLYSQPGKHAFSPSPLIFRLLPDAETATGPGAGSDGALIGGPLEGRVAREPWWDAAARDYLRSRAFSPAWAFQPYAIPQELLIPWDRLDRMLPALFVEGLNDLKGKNHGVES
jgi:hypothetical protein